VAHVTEKELTMTATAPPGRRCGTTQYGVVEQCSGAPIYDLLVRDSEGGDTARTPSCFTHSLAAMSALLGEAPTRDVDIVKVGS
jgi:hypothetical protein